MNYIADLHIHSPFSRSTSPDSNLYGLAAWARIKGIQIVGTGDFTHPGWFRRLKEELEPAEPGLFRLRDESLIPELLPGVRLPQTPVRFLLSAEVSSIYKRHGATRKVHNLLYVPDFAAAERINARLAAIGNIESDGRPILGLDSRNLLEIVLAASPEGFLVPAHIWTPWFSLFGSRSGFDSVEECFDDLSEHIFALETGLSSDPAMNRTISALDRFALISNSDCHSPGKLGREANLFSTGFDFFSLRDALKDNHHDTFSGTIEFFPEEGKYHADGHRACNVCLHPQESRQRGNLCPVCGKPLTIGVQNRVLELADRDTPLFSPSAPVVHSLIPLPEILGEILGLGPAAKETQRQYGQAINRFGAEFEILLHTSVAALAEWSPLLGEAVQRMRGGKVLRQSGYDGEFGVIRVFAEGELEKLAGQSSLFGDDPPRPRRKKKTLPEPLMAEALIAPQATAEGAPTGPNLEQQVAIHCSSRHVLVAAGPGTGKTYTLVERLVALLKAGVDPATLWAITFTNRAADELRQRLVSRAGRDAEDLFVGTFHVFCLEWLRREKPQLLVVGPAERLRLLHSLFPERSSKERQALVKAIAEHFSAWAANDPALPHPDLQSYLAELTRLNAIDLDGVIPTFLAELEGNSDFDDEVRETVLQLFVDEFQDLDAGQYELVRTLGETSRIFAIGDPDQSIYSFRGSDPGFFFDFSRAPETTRLQMVRNYRSAGAIVAAAAALIDHNQQRSGLVLRAEARHSGVIEVATTPSAAAEAEFIVRRIEELVGGIESFSLYSGRGGEAGGRGHSFAEIAILIRSRRQAEPLLTALERRGIPCQQVGVPPFYMTSSLVGLYHFLQLASGEGTISDGLALLRSCGILPAAAFDQLEPAFPLAGDFFSVARTLELPAAIVKQISELSDLLPLFVTQARQFGIATALEGHKAFFSSPDDDPQLRRLLDLAGSFGRDLSAFASHLRRNAGGTVYDAGSEAVALLTLHAAKGLEFPVVFLPGLEEGLLPATLSGNNDIEEERRLFYVGLTRAKNQAILSTAATRSGPSSPSRFLQEIPAAFLTVVEAAPNRRRTRPGEQMELF
ncbi:MAG: UvrD-helicase domain-containing protein [Desulfuromonadales bacterium]|nr:UvrD-helicase domain-containing protein [Desulfuromonadales bacterium]